MPILDPRRSRRLPVVEGQKSAWLSRRATAPVPAATWRLPPIRAFPICLRNHDDRRHAALAHAGVRNVCVHSTAASLVSSHEHLPSAFQNLNDLQHAALAYGGVRNVCVHSTALPSPRHDQSWQPFQACAVLDRNCCGGHPGAQRSETQAKHWRRTARSTRMPPTRTTST